MENTHQEADRPVTPGKGKGKAVEFDVLREIRVSISGRTTPSSEVLSEDDILVHAAPRSPIEMMQEPEAPSFEQDEFRYVMSLYRQKRYFEQLADAFRPGTSAGENEGSQSGSDHFEDDGIHLAKPVGNRSRRSLGNESDGKHSDTSDRGRYERALQASGGQEHVGPSSNQGTSGEQLGDRDRQGQEHKSHVTDSDAMSDQEFDEIVNAALQERYGGILGAFREIGQGNLADELPFVERFRRELQNRQEGRLRILDEFERRHRGPSSHQETGEGTITYQDVLRIAQESSDEDEQEHVGSSSGQRTGEGRSGEQSDRDRQGSEYEGGMTDSDVMSDQETGGSRITRRRRAGTGENEPGHGNFRSSQHVGESDAMFANRVNFEHQMAGDRPLTAAQRQQRMLGRNTNRERNQFRQSSEDESDTTDSGSRSDQEFDDTINATLQDRHMRVMISDDK